MSDFGRFRAAIRGILDGSLKSALKPGWEALGRYLCSLSRVVYQEDDQIALVLGLPPSLVRLYLNVSVLAKIGALLTLPTHLQLPAIT